MNDNSRPFPIDLWHGTSKHLLPSIEKHGLGGIDLMGNWGVISFLREVFPHLGYTDGNFNDPHYLSLIAMNAALEQRKGHMNFQYGDLYAAGSLEKAQSWAKQAPEQMHFAKLAMEIGRERAKTKIDAILDGYPEIRNFIAKEPFPIVLKLPKLSFDRICDESGGDPYFVEEIGSAVANVTNSQLGFRVKGVIPFDQIDVYKV